MITYEEVTEPLDTKFPTWIIAYCPDTGSFYVTNERFWFWEYEKEFDTEKEGIEYFENHIKKFMVIEKIIKDRMVFTSVNHAYKPVFLENTKKFYLE